MTSGFKKMLVGVMATSALVRPLAAAADTPLGGPLLEDSPFKVSLFNVSPLKDSSSKDSSAAAARRSTWPPTSTRFISFGTHAPIPPEVLRTNARAAEQCGPLTGRAPHPAIDARIKDFTSLLNQSATGRDLSQAATDYQSGQPAWMCFDTLEDAHALYYAGRGVLVVNASKSNHEIVGDALHELRHLFHEKTGLYALHAESANDQAHLKYVSEADAEATAALALWELKQAGHSGPWDKQDDPRSYDKRRVCYAHITTSFKNAVESGMSPALASAQAFRTWYRDKNLLSYYRDGVMETPNPAAGPEDTTSNPCTRADPARLIRQFEMPSDPIMQQIMTRVGELPSYKINYLQQAGGLKAILSMP